MTKDVWLEEAYFGWLRDEAFTSRNNRRDYEGVLRLMHDIPFYWTLWGDENRAGDALSFRQSDFLGYQEDLDSLDQVWLGQWATAAPSVLEVLLGCARRYTYYFQGPIQYYFGHLFRNLELDRFPGKILTGASADAVRIKLDNWMSHQYQPNGYGSPFPVNDQYALDILDMRKLEIWSQMNAYSAEHFQ